MPRAVDEALARAVAIPSSTIHAHVEKVRSRNPEASPERIIKLLEKEYLLVVAGAGGAVGAAAAAPAVGTGVALALTASDVATFFGASAAYVLAVASVHGIDVEDSDRRRALLLTSLLGESGTTAVAEVTGQQGAVGVARLLLVRTPIATVKKVNSTLTRRMVRKQVARQGGLFFGPLIPYGIGVVVGVTGARALGRTVIQGARAAFGPAPATFGHVVELEPAPARQLEASDPPALPAGAAPTSAPHPAGLPPAPAAKDAKKKWRNRR